MKVSISYPPLESGKGVPLLGQNRQFQWFTEPTYIYPMVPAYAATLLRANGFDVMWDDAIAEGLSYSRWLEGIRSARPDVIAIETKTPVVKRHWAIIEDIKRISAGGRPPKVVLYGDHVTALPEETMLKSKADFVITGGDYDFLLLNICGYLRGKSEVRSVRLEPGIWHREEGVVKNTGAFVLTHDLDQLPFIDRDLTRWRLYSEKNGNYKHLPGTYTMAARDCWWGRCSFCSWTTIFPGKDYRARSPEKMADEVGLLIGKYGVREIMDDSGTFPVGGWLSEFCSMMIKRGYNSRVRLDCNMRFGALKEKEFRLMRKAGFRFVLFGLESANQTTLDRVAKNLRAAEIVEGAKAAKAAGLSPHVTVMLGYPWETKEDALRTIGLAKEMFRQGCIDTLQATIVMPYPGTPLFEECGRNGWLLTEDWDRYDMRERVMYSPMTEEDIKELTRTLYKSFVSVRFIARKLLAVRTLDDLRFLKRAGRKFMGHLADFGQRPQAAGKA